MKNILRTTAVILILFSDVLNANAFDRADILPLNASFVSTNVSVCGNGHDGTIAVTASGGAAPYTYEWSGPANFTAGNTAFLSNLPIGYYNVTVRDASQGSVTISWIHINFAWSVYITNSGAASSLCGNTGAIILYGNAGVLPYSYSLDGNVYQASNTFTGLAAGTYTAYVRDAAGCVSTKNIMIPSVPPIDVNPFTRVASSCEDNGSIEIYRTGGIPPYTYSLDNINYQTNNKYFNLPGGTYRAWVKDSKGCTAFKEVTVKKDDPIVMHTTVTNSSCLYDGRINIVTTGGLAPYYYTFNGVDCQYHSSFKDLPADTYEISVKDLKGCSVINSVEVLQDQINVTAEKTDASDCASIDGTIQISNTGEFGPFTYSVDGFNYQTSPMFNGISSGIYYCYAMDSKGCIGMLPGLPIGPYDCSPEKHGRKGETRKAAAKTAFGINAYPNPFVTGFTLSLNDNNSTGTVMITITDMLGKKVSQVKEKARNQYDLGKELQPGVYYVEVLRGNEKRTIKIIKVK